MADRRETRKSRMVNDLADGVVSLVNEKGDFAPSKDAIVREVAQSNLSESASAAARALLEQELANLLETYWSEVCKQAAEELRLEYHYTSKAYYRKKRTMPQSEVEARQYVVVFGNGRTGKAAGVRFVTEDDAPDPMLLVALEKRIDVISKAIETHRQNIDATIGSAAISLPDKTRMQQKMPRLIGPAAR